MRAPAARSWRRGGLAWLAFLGPFFYLSYGLANHAATLRPNVPSLVFEWERGIPFLAWTVYPYWSINLLYGLSLLLCRTRHELDRHALRLLTAQVAAVACFMAFPLAFTFGQPPAEGAAGWLFDALRSFDKPFNQAPSLHIALGIILWDLYRRWIRSFRARVLITEWAVLIGLSTLTTYQHHFIDLPTGAFLGLLCVWAWPLERRVALWRCWQWTRDAGRLRLALAYAAGAAVSFAAGALIGGIALWLMWPGVSLLLVAVSYGGLGPRGFCKQAGGRKHWVMNWLLAPYLVGARVNALWWTRREARATRVAGNVWLGRMPCSAASARPWAGIIDLTAEFDVPGRGRVHCVPMIDLVVPPPAALRRAARAIEAHRASPGNVLVCCALGYSRSAAAVAAWLLVSGMASSAERAVAMVRMVKRSVVLGDAHRRAIHQAAGGRACP